MIISGPSGVGKNTLIDYMKKRYNISFEIPFTSREPRPQEIEKNEYYFLSKKEFQKRIAKNDFLDWDYTLNNYYGFRKDFSPNKNTHIITHALARLALRLKVKLPFTYLVFLLPENFNEILARLSSRGIDSNQLQSRILHGEEEIEHSALFDQIVKIPNGQNITERCQEIWDYFSKSISETPLAYREVSGRSYKGIVNIRKVT